MTEIYDHLQSQTEVNYGAVGARPGSVIDAMAGNYGKTWTITHFARWYELQLRAHGTRRAMLPGASDDFVPVVYVALRRGSKTTEIDLDILNFYGTPIGSRTRVRDYASIVADEAHACDTSLVLIDDIHKLRRWREDDVDISHHLNYLATAVPATFIYAGIGCIESGVFSEGGGGFVVDSGSTSTQGRFTHLEINAFELDESWQSLLADFEDELVLLKAEDGMLYADLPEYLFERTGGVLGSISQLLRRAANRAIESGDERITERQLKRLHIDEAARAREEEARRSRRASVKS